MRTLSLCAVLALLLPSVAAVNDWPQARYDETHQGAVPASLNSEFVPFLVRWWNNLSLPGQVGSPAVREDIVYYGDSAGKIWAFDRESGGILWSNTTGSGSRISSTPAVGQDFVYVVNEAGQLYSFNRKTGVIQNGYPISVGATFGSVMLHEDILYVGTADGSVKAYYASTRQPRWTMATSGTFPPTTGHVCDAGSVDGTPVLFEQWVFFGSTNKCFYAIPRTSGGTVQPAQVSWVFKAIDAIRSTPTIDRANRRVIFGDVSGNIYAIPVASAGRVNSSTWTFNEPFVEGRPSEFKAGGAIWGDKVIVAARNGNVRGLSLASGASMWLRSLGGEVSGSPAVANGRVLVGSFDRNIYILDANDGAIQQQKLGLAEIDTSPAISGTQGLWGDKLGNLYSWGGTKPDRPDLSLISLSGSFIAGITGTISFTVRNVGVLPAGNNTLTIHVAGAKVAEINVPSLDPGKDFSTSFNHVVASEGSLKVRVFVDATRLVKESDESNNVKDFDATVAAPPPPVVSSSADGAPGPGLLLALAAVLGAAFVARRRRR